MMLSTLIPAPWRWLALAAVVAVIGWSRWQVHSLRADLAAARAEAAQLRAEIQIQTAAVERWRDEADRRARIAQEARFKAAEYRRQAEARKTRLEDYNAAGKGECDALTEIIDLARGWQPLGSVQ